MFPKSGFSTERAIGKLVSVTVATQDLKNTRISAAKRLVLIRRFAKSAEHITEKQTPKITNHQKSGLSTERAIGKLVSVTVATQDLKNTRISAAKRLVLIRRFAKSAEHITEKQTPKITNHQKSGLSTERAIGKLVSVTVATQGSKKTHTSAARQPVLNRRFAKFAERITEI